MGVAFEDGRPSRGDVTTEDSAAHRHPEDVAALVNAVLVLLLPLVLLTVGMFVFPSASVIVRPEESFYVSTARVVMNGALVLVPLAPFAMLAGWRTWVHARRYRDGRGNGWQGVVEGGTAGFVAVFFMFSRDFATRPREASAYVIAYGGASALVGLAFGLVLWTAAVLVLKRLGVRSQSTAP